MVNLPPLSVSFQLLSGDSLDHLLPDSGALDAASKAQDVGHRGELGRRCDVRIQVQKGLDLRR